MQESEPGFVLTIRALFDSSAGGVVTHTALQVRWNPVVVAGVDQQRYGACVAHGARVVRGTMVGWERKTTERWGPYGIILGVASSPTKTVPV